MSDDGGWVLVVRDGDCGGRRRAQRKTDLFKLATLASAGRVVSCLDSYGYGFLYDIGFTYTYIPPCSRALEVWTRGHVHSLQCGDYTVVTLPRCNPMLRPCPTIYPPWRLAPPSTTCNVTRPRPHQQDPPHHCTRHVRHTSTTPSPPPARGCPSARPIPPPRPSPRARYAPCGAGVPCSSPPARRRAPTSPHM